MTNESQCPVCGSRTDLTVLESRNRVPTLQNTTLETLDLACAYPTGQLKMLRCGECTFVWNGKFDEAIIAYDDAYNNDVSTSAYYVNHLNAMADRILRSVPEGQKLHFVEVGCGEGDFMRLLAEKAGDRFGSATGFDPSFTNPDGIPDRAIVHKCFFTPDRIDMLPAKTNVVISRHTIEHVPDVQAFASALSASVQSSDVTLFVETPDANWILENNAFQDFFYEHCSLYTPRSIQTLFEHQGLQTKVFSVYDDQYMWAECRRTEGALNSDIARDMSDALGTNYVENRSKLMKYWSSKIETAKQKGPVAVWGAASKGVTFALLFSDTAATAIDFAIDLNTAKQDRFLPLTGIPVVSPVTASKMSVATVIIMNPNYEQEIRDLAKQMHWQPDFEMLNG